MNLTERAPGADVPRARVPARTLTFTAAEVKVLLDAGISRQLISAWHRGIALPNKKTAVIVARLTGRSLVECLYGRTDVLNDSAPPEVANPEGE